MKILQSLVTLLLITSTAFTQAYTPTDKGSKVHFVIKNFGIKTGGDFTGLKGSIVFNPTAVNTSQFSVTVSSASVNTDNGTRDGHLKKSEYFDVVKYPLISFVSTSVSETSVSGKYLIKGNLTIKNITKLVQFNFIATPIANGFSFNGEFDINRRDFGVGGSSMSMSDNLKVSLAISAAK
jgi:polyisoprenoid-binding protein YceI